MKNKYSAILIIIQILEKLRPYIHLQFILFVAFHLFNNFFVEAHLTVMPMYSIQFHATKLGKMKVRLIYPLHWLANQGDLTLLSVMRVARPWLDWLDKSFLSLCFSHTRTHSLYVRLNKLTFTCGRYNICSRYRYVLNLGRKVEILGRTKF